MFMDWLNKCEDYQAIITIWSFNETPIKIHVYFFTRIDKVSIEPEKTQVNLSNCQKKKKRTMPEE